jgi:hypothetical protein
MSAPCRLCGNVAELRHSHIIPDFFIRSVESRLVTGDQGESQPFSMLLSTRTDVQGGQRQRGQWERIVGLKERLLCEACEQKFSRWEKYFREEFYENGSGPRLQKKDIGIETEPAPSDVTSAPNGFLGARLVTLDYAKLKFFILSMIWRASVASGTFFSGTNLGPYEPEVRDMLLAEDAKSDAYFPFVMADLRHDGRALEDMFEQPMRGRDETFTVYSWTFGGFLVVIFMSTRGNPVFMNPFVLKDTGTIVIVRASAVPMLRTWAQRLRLS